MAVKFSYPLFLNPSLKRLTQGYNALVDHVNTYVVQNIEGYAQNSPRITPYEGSGLYVVNPLAVYGTAFDGANNLTANKANYVPVYVAYDTKFHGMAFGNVAAVGTNVKMALFEGDGNKGLPGTLIEEVEETASLSATSTINMDFTAQRWLGPGKWYWIGILADASLALYRHPVATHPIVAVKDLHDGTGTYSSLRRNITYSTGFASDPSLALDSESFGPPVLALRSAGG